MWVGGATLPMDLPFSMDDDAIGALGWILIVVLVLIFFGVIGFSFNA